MKLPTLLLFGALLGVFLTGLNTGLFLLREERGFNGGEIAVDLRIDYGSGDLQSFPAESLRAGSAVLELLEALEERYGVPVETRKFSGVGVFVEAIHGVRNTESSYWQYWVNGEYARVGAGQYILKDGDEVLWKRTGE